MTYSAFKMNWLKYIYIKINITVTMLSVFFGLKFSFLSEVTGKDTAPVFLLMFASAVCTAASPSDFVAFDFISSFTIYTSL